jgi:hypothetical protein
MKIEITDGNTTSEKFNISVGNRTTGKELPEDMCDNFIQLPEDMMPKTKLTEVMWRVDYKPRPWRLTRG